MLGTTKQMCKVYESLNHPFMKSFVFKYGSYMGRFPQDGNIACFVSLFEK